MALKELVRLRQRLLEVLDTISDDTEILKKSQQLDILIQEQTIAEYSADLSAVKNEYLRLDQQHTEIIELYKKLVYKVEADISAYVVNHSINGQLEEHIVLEHDLGSDLADIVYTKMTAYCNFKYPSLCISPRNKRWIDALVSSDPLYLTSIKFSNIDNLISDYNTVYQNRLRLYTINKDDFDILPKQQFGFILCWDWLDYLDAETIDSYLQKMYDLLRPGGVFMFSYNNCNFEGSAGAAELGSHSYYTDQRLKTLCKNIGYEIIDLTDAEVADPFKIQISWAELKKPGTLATVKCTQSLAQIMEK